MVTSLGGRIDLKVFALANGCHDQRHHKKVSSWQGVKEKKRATCVTDVIIKQKMQLYETGNRISAILQVFYSDVEQNNYSGFMATIKLLNFKHIIKPVSNGFNNASLRYTPNFSCILM